MPPYVDVYDACPEGQVCISIEGAVGIAQWADQLERYRVMVAACPGVQMVKPITESLSEWESREQAEIGAPATE